MKPMCTSVESVEVPIVSESKGLLREVYNSFQGLDNFWYELRRNESGDFVAYKTE